MNPDVLSAMTPTETIVAEIWAAELHSDYVGPGSDFFELGGDSILLLNMLFRVGQSFGVELAPEALFSDTTLGGFCRNVDQAVAKRAALSNGDVIDGSI